MRILPCICVAILLVGVSLGGYYCYLNPDRVGRMLEVLVGVALWDIGRTLAQTWYLTRQLRKGNLCKKCQQNL